MISPLVPQVQVPSYTSARASLRASPPCLEHLCMHPDILVGQCCRAPACRPESLSRKRLRLCALQALSGRLSQHGRPVGMSGHTCALGPYPVGLCGGRLRLRHWLRPVKVHCASWPIHGRYAPLHHPRSIRPYKSSLGVEKAEVIQSSGVLVVGLGKQAVRHHSRERP